MRTMAIACAEAGRQLTAANVARFNPAHPRCGTGFLVILAAVDTLLLAALPRIGPMEDLALRVAFVPVTAAIAYELLRWGARRRGLGFALNRFGLLTQRLTTAYPDVGQIEVAIAAVEACRTGVRAEPTAEAASLPAAGLPFSCPGASARPVARSRAGRRPRTRVPSRCCRSRRPAHSPPGILPAS